MSSRRTAPLKAADPRRVALVAYPDIQVLDVTGPLEVFARTARWLCEHGRRATPAYTTELLATTSGTITASSGLRLGVDRRLREVRGRIDTLLVAGGSGARAAMQDALLLRWLRSMAPRVRRLGSVCTGAFVLAEAGLLDGRRATTHWRACAALARGYPQISVDPDPIFVRDGNLYTSAGVTAGMDLALALVEEDHGREVALQVARELVLFLRRPGGQSQFSTQLAVQAADREPLRELQAWIADHLDMDLSVPALAGRVAMSPRNFARVFTREVGVTPARFVEMARIEAVRRRLEESAHGVDAIAAQCGFGTAESMRRAFVRHLRVPPSAYRHRFTSTAIH
ncbi:MAG TPA: GlxA family transcriptional regulator [Candidatus Margulisiibacteriota bacterium]|nr:GlxA family transcriptional regulator [Candidatus Margulisiibacteriota bacterium]